MQQIKIFLDSLDNTAKYGVGFIVFLVVLLGAIYLAPVIAKKIKSKKKI